MSYRRNFLVFIKNGYIENSRHIIEKVSILEYGYSVVFLAHLGKVLIVSCCNQSPSVFHLSVDGCPPLSL